MHKPNRLLSFLIAFSSFALCFGTFQDHPHAVSHYYDDDDHQINGHDHPREASSRGLDSSLYTIGLRNQHDVNPKHGSLLKTRWRKTHFYRRATSSARLDRGRRRVSGSMKMVNVDGYGAKGNGEDDSQAFQLAWMEACSSIKAAILLVPKGRIYNLKPITFSGPCRSPLIFKVSGVINASPKQSDYNSDRRHWIKFEDINNLIVEGKGVINGNGRTWWQSSCKVKKFLPCKEAPTAVTFYQCTNLIVANLEFKNAQQMHISFDKCFNVKALNLKVIAPGNSPNTDGIHVTGTQNAIVRNCVIGTGDDCISIVSGSRNVQAMDITCGPGHGISIGSLGARNSEAEVSNIKVNRARFTGTTNGVRIKTWQGGSGYAKNILFQNVEMNNVSNPIIIDQNYCDQQDPCEEQSSAVQVSNVVYKNIRGTSASEEAIKFDCSRSLPCQGISLLGVNLFAQRNEVTTASCQNVRLKNRWKVHPFCS